MNIQQELQNVHIFAHLNNKQLSRVEQHAVKKTIQAGELLFVQGDAASHFYVVVQGQIKLFRASPGGSEKIIEVVSAGGTFGEALMFNEASQYPVGTQALTTSMVISIDSRDFLQMLRESTDTLLLMMGDLTLRLRGLLREIDELSQYSSINRIAAYLLRIKPLEQNDFTLPVTKQVLASRLSVTPETLSRVIKQLVQKQIISINGSKINILDEEALENIADACALHQDQLENTFHIVD
jgi:CRP-like cAMP-binding protein